MSSARASPRCRRAPSYDERRRAPTLHAQAAALAARIGNGRERSSPPARARARAARRAVFSGRPESPAGFVGPSAKGVLGSSEVRDTAVSCSRSEQVTEAPRARQRLCLGPRARGQGRRCRRSHLHGHTIGAGPAKATRRGLEVQKVRGAARQAVGSACRQSGSSVAQRLSGITRRAARSRAITAPQW